MQLLVPMGAFPSGTSNWMAASLHALRALAACTGMGRSNHERTARCNGAVAQGPSVDRRLFVAVSLGKWGIRRHGWKCRWLPACLRKHRMDGANSVAAEAHSRQIRAA
jgi:hypothetical protein